VAALQVEGSLDISLEEMMAAVRRAYLRGLAIERKQGYEDSEYTLPDQVFEQPNQNVQTESFVTREFFAELQDKVWAVFNKEIEAL